MFNYLSGVGTELHAQFVQMYWVLIVPFVALLCVLEILKDESPNLKEIFRRLVISILLLYSFDWVVSSIGTVGDAITSQVNGLEKLSDVLAKLGPNYAGHDSLFSLRETAIYILSLGSYLVAYLGFFVATALTHFVWTILYVCAPLMILMFVSRHTSAITMSLYKGLIQVVIWKILWSILGVLLLKLAIQPQNSGLDDYLMSMIVNLCIGISMLFIPMATKSLISDGMSSFASTLSLAPAIAAAGAIKIAATKWAGHGATAMKNAGVFAAKPLTNPVAGRMQLMKERLKPRFESFKKNYGSIGLPQELQNRRKRDF
jgi:hypothetical protein